MAIKAGCDGNFTDGLCCRMVIETKRVFDGCKFTENNISITLTTAAQLPQNAVFESARITSSELVGYTITQHNDGCYRVYGDIVTHFAVTYSSGGLLTTVDAQFTETRDVFLRLPDNNSIVPYSIDVTSYMRVLSGAVVGPNAITVNGCLLQIIKVTAPVDILIPTYGYCKYPPCTGCVCPGIDQEVFPTIDDN
ncbi:MAG: hypothetical protein HDT28_05965 [Clostridiales bacterium]|nr:hypothetical protein [Clostridiales bacterium]